MRSPSPSTRCAATSPTWGHDIASYFDEARANVARWAQDVQRDADDVVRWFQALPGKIGSALASLPGMLFRAGENAIEGLLNGMKSMVGGALSTVEGWGHDIANALVHPFGIHFSEPSEATQMVKAGQNVAAALSKGMLSGRGAVAAAAQQLGAAAGLAGGGAAAAGAGGGITIEFNVSNAGQLGADFWKQFQNGVRVKGGDPNIVTKKVKFQ